MLSPQTEIGYGNEEKKSARASVCERGIFYVTLDAGHILLYNEGIIQGREGETD
jgi:hypothetical protein